MTNEAGLSRSPEPRIVIGGLEDERVVTLLGQHLLRARAETAAGSAHALDLGGLQRPDIAFWSLWSGEELLAVGALRDLGDGMGELKSMYTAERARRRGFGARMLAHIVAEARGAGLSRLYLETGSWPYFDPARALYAAHGFTECPPFGDYRPDPNSVFMVRRL